jgi:hypothetical protein
MTQVLTYGMPIRSASWYDSVYAEIFTIAGYATARGADPAEQLARAKALGHNIVGSIFTGTALLGDRQRAAAELKWARDIAATAAVVATGDEVEIEGRLYRVRFARGNENGKAPVNSNPIAFDPIPSTETEG